MGGGGGGGGDFISADCPGALFKNACWSAGLDRVYEINRSFRNEGVSTRHNRSLPCWKFIRLMPIMKIWLI